MNNNIRKAQQLIDCYNKNNPNQTFTCFGPTGPAGEQGPAGEDAQVTYAYASKYQQNTQSLTANANVITQVPLSTNGPSLNVNTQDANKFTITEAGVYKIDYFFLGTPNVATTLTLEVRNGGNTIDGAKIAKDADADVLIDIQGSVLTTLAENDEIDLAISSSANATITPENSTNAYLIIQKVN